MSAPRTAAAPPSLEAIRETRTLTVLHIVAPAPVGGLERVVRTLARGQQESGLDVRVAAIVDQGEEERHPFIRELREAGVPVEPIGVTARAYSSERAAVAALCRRHAPHVVHTHGYRPDVIDSAPARRLSIASCTTFHGFTRGDWRNRLYERAQRWVARRFDAVVAVSAPIGEELARSGVRRDRVHVIPNAHQPRGEFVDRVTARRTLGLPDEGFIVGWIGRMTSEKGADVLLDAVGRDRDETLRVSFIGAGPDTAPLQLRASRSGMDKRTSWHGLVPDAGRYLRAFDAFVLSSRTEGTPMVVFEAMEAGTPIVATAVGGVPAVLRPEDAMLVASEDAGAIASALRAIRDNPAAAYARAKSARARLTADYSVAPWLARYEAVYRHVAITRAVADLI